jgi:glycosyltransferase involved in cell wall biosynthesis
MTDSAVSHTAPAANAAGSADRPLVSIIVPSFNHARFLPATLDSILLQDYRPLQLVVMDGASKDGTVEILRQYAERHPELEWRSEPDKGPADAVNKALALARGSITGIQSSDDIYLPGAISAAVAALAAHPQAALVYADAYQIDGEGRSISEPTHWAPYSLEAFLLTRTVILQSSAFFRTAVGQQLGGWDGRYFACDVEFWLRMLFRAPAVKLDQVWSAYRRHEIQRDKETRKVFDSYWRIIGESADLRRAPLRLRLAADAGRRVFVQYYNPGSQGYMLYQLWRAVLTYPPVFRSLRYRGLLLPGLGPALHALRQKRRQPDAA